LGVPYQNLNAPPGTDFGEFKYHASFITFVSALNLEAEDDKDRFRHLCSVRWEANLNGTFEGPRSPGELGKVTANAPTPAARVKNPTTESPKASTGTIAFDILTAKWLECIKPSAPRE